MKIPVAKIGHVQKKDIEKSTGIRFYDDIGRICTVVKKPCSSDDRGDRSPYRMAELFGGHWKDYNNHFIVQVAGCPLRCSYCYVDNLKPDVFMTSEKLVNKFIGFKEKAEHNLGIKLNVFHLMGGAPGIYPEFWGELRRELDHHGLDNVVLFSDVIFVENHFFKSKPWNFLNLHHFMLTGCLKGTSRHNFIKNTGSDLFKQSLDELKQYLYAENFYVTLIGFDKKDLKNIYKIVSKSRIDFLTIINYEVTKLINKKANETQRISRKRDISKIWNKSA